MSEQTVAAPSVPSVTQLHCTVLQDLQKDCDLGLQSQKSRWPWGGVFKFHIVAFNRTEMHLITECDTKVRGSA